MLTENELALLQLIRESEKPEKVAGYVITLCLDYLRTHGPAQENMVAHTTQRS